MTRRNWLRNLLHWRPHLRLGGREVAALTVLALVSVVVLSAIFWEWLSDGESGSTTVRNVGLVIGGVIAIPLAGWRGIVAEQSLLDERYQKSAEMLGNELLSVRLGGIYALQRLAENHPERYHLQIMRLFCAFVRHHTERESTTSAEKGGGSELGAGGGQANLVPKPREDVQAIMTAIGSRSRRSVRFERQKEYRLDFRDADLRGARLDGANLACADFTQAKLSGVDFCGTDLSGAKLILANLSCPPLSRANLNRALTAMSFDQHDPRVTLMMDVDLSDADLSGADLSNAVMPYANLSGAYLVVTDLSGTDISQARFSIKGRNPARSVTQAGLDKACADAGGGPDLEGLVDGTTGKALVWHDRPCQ